MHAPADLRVLVDVGGGRGIVTRVFPAQCADVDAGGAGRFEASDLLRVDATGARGRILLPAAAGPDMLAAHVPATAARRVYDGPFAEDLGRPPAAAGVPRLELPLPPISPSQVAAALSPCVLDSTSRVIGDQNRAAAPSSREVEPGSQAPSEAIDVTQTSIPSVEPSPDAADFLAGLTRPEGTEGGLQGNTSTERVCNGVVLRAYQSVNQSERG